MHQLKLQGSSTQESQFSKTIWNEKAEKFIEQFNKLMQNITTIISNTKQVTGKEAKDIRGNKETDN